MKNNAIVANAGHFNVEASIDDLEALSSGSFERKPFITGYRMKDGRTINLMAEGRLVNIAAGNGHPAEIMDLSFAIQALCAEYLAKCGRALAPKLYSVPRDIDDAVAMIKLNAMGLGLDTLTDEQRAYWEGNI